MALRPAGDTIVSLLRRAWRDSQWMQLLAASRLSQICPEKVGKDKGDEH